MSTERYEMGWSIGCHNGRDIGYGVPACCDHPGCGAMIHRGLAYVCGGEPYGGEQGCGLFFCEVHRRYIRNDGTRAVCERCAINKPPFDAKPDVREWIDHKLYDESWANWRAEHPDWVAQHQTYNGALTGPPLAGPGSTRG